MGWWQLKNNSHKPNKAKKYLPKKEIFFIQLSQVLVKLKNHQRPTKAY